MGFFSPWFLAGIAAIGLPVWLHLLRQFKRTPQPFSSLMFFERRIQSSTKHRRLRYLALLAMRLALLILLAIAFANPFFNRKAATIKRRGLNVIAIDRSFSMRYGNHLQRAKAEAHRLLNALPGGSFAEVIAVDSRIESLAEPQTDKTALNASIETLSPTDQTSSYGEFSRALRAMDQTTGTQLRVHFISDVQQTSMPAAFTDLQVGPHTTLEIHSVADALAPNWAIESVTAPAHVYDPAHVRVTATVASWEARTATRKVSLLLNGKVLGSKDVVVPDCGQAEVEFTGFEVPYGANRGELRIEPHDSLPQDDSFIFSMERSDPRKVLFLYAHARARDAFYYRAAIDSSANIGLTVQAEPIEQALGQDFSKYAFVVLSDPGTMENQLERDICSYVSKGGAVLVSAGPNSTIAGRVAVAENAIGRTSQTQGAGLLDKQDRALGGIGHFENVQFFATPHLAVKPKDRVIAKYADGSPLLVEQPNGEGRILIFASTLDNSGNDFPLHATFLPFVARTAAYLSGAEDNSSSIIVGTPVALRRTQVQTTAADVIGPDGQHELSIAEATRAISFDVPREGFYEVQRADGRRQLVAAHADRRESDLTPVPDETLNLWRNTGRNASDEESGTADQQRRPWSFWRYVLILVTIAALVESVFANRYLREERRTA